MSDTKPIYLIAKNLGVESSGIISACQSLGISAKASSKRLDKKDQDKIINYFKTGKNVAQETIDLNKPVNLSKNEFMISDIFLVFNKLAPSLLLIRNGGLTELSTIIFGLTFNLLAK